MGTLPEHLSGLLQAGAYPHPVQGVHVVQTHMSWVLLTGEYAYKIKRPVCYPFVDMREGARRHELCLEELRLNRRFAAALYLDVCPVVCRAGKACMGGDGEAIEYAVRMRQFLPDQELAVLLDKGNVDPAELHAFGTALADLYPSLPKAAEADNRGSPAATGNAIISNLDQAMALESRLPGTHRIEALSPSMRARLHQLESWMAARRAGGHVRECHGDLHCGNVVRWSGVLHAFDCLEFEPALRWMDVAQDVAFLIADLEARGATMHAHAFLCGYLERSSDYGICRGLDMYKAHCALVRAKVAMLAVDQHGAVPAGFAALVDTASRSLELRQPVLIVVMGLSGSGKTSLAKRLAPLLDAIHLQSDVERKRMAGMKSGDRSGSDVGAQLYSPAASARLYAHLFRCAGEVLAAGRNVIVDATFNARADRRRIRQIARDLGIALRVIVCRAPVAVLRQRVQQRAASGSGASEADDAVLAWQLDHADPVQAGEGLDEYIVDTAAEPGSTAMTALARHCRR